MPISLVRANKGAPGIDGLSFESIREEEGAVNFLQMLEINSNICEMETGASLTMKNIGKPCTGKPYARFDEGALMKVGTLEYVVAACGGASTKDQSTY